MYVCICVCMYQGRVQVGSLQGSLASDRFKVRSHRIAPRSGCKHDDDDDDGDSDDDDDYDDGDDVPPPLLFA